ncbi:DUF4129 domain-containing protein [Paraliobacillus sediminis]|uniref:DUF4129 domain-containing protein n=1 Tax=Paraliobacillus sediminis TaxID=1885916 RepID=UPI000E3DFE0B|nr:DUF4129 domain-containing protein [Paraliobacillus sediminis]
MIQRNDVFQTFPQTFIEYIGFFPILLGVTIWFVPVSLYVYFLIGILLLYMLGICIGKFFQKKVLITLSIFSIALIHMLLYDGTLIQKIGVLLLSSGILFRGIQYSRTNWNVLLPVHIMWSFGVPLYFISYFIYRYTTAFETYLPVITASGIVFLVLLLFRSNTSHLEEATLDNNDKKSVNAGIRKQNYVYITIMLAVITIFTQFGLVKTIIITTLRMMFLTISSFFGLFESDAPIEEPVQEAPSEMPFQVEEINEPSQFARILEMVATITAIVVFIVAVIFIVYKISNNFKKFIVWVISIIHRMIEIIGGKSLLDKNTQTHPDEKETLFDWNKFQNKIKGQTSKFVKLRLLKQKKWEVLSETEKIRFLYRQFVKKAQAEGYEVMKNETAHELLTRIDQDQLLEKETRLKLDQLYNQARYSQEQEQLKKVNKDDFQQLFNK